MAQSQKRKKKKTSYPNKQMNRKGKLKACYNGSRYLHKGCWGFQSWEEGIQVENENEYVQGKQKISFMLLRTRGWTIRISEAT